MFQACCQLELMLCSLKYQKKKKSQERKKRAIFFFFLEEEYVVLFMDLILPPDSQSSYIKDTSHMLDLISKWVRISVKHRVSIGIILDDISQSCNNGGDILSQTFLKHSPQTFSNHFRLKTRLV